MGKDEDLLKVCQEFVNAVFDPKFSGTPEGAYLAGTTSDGNLYKEVLPCDCQTWTLLADADTDTDRGRFAMDAVLKVFYMEEAPGSPSGTSYAGVRFSDHSDGIQMENTASCAMSIAKYIHDVSDPGTELPAALKAMDSTLTDLVDKNMGGVPAAIQRTASGYGYDYFPTLHVASTVWTGMFFGCTRGASYDANFNPYQVDKAD